jgi:hypothetical protein
MRYLGRSARRVVRKARKYGRFDPSRAAAGSGSGGAEGGSASGSASGEKAARAFEALHSEWIDRQPIRLADLAVDELRTTEPECCRILRSTEDFVYEAVPVGLAVPFSFLMGVQLGKRLAAGELDALLR